MKSRSAKYCIQSLEKWWGDKLVSDITTANCRAYAATKSQSAARTDLQALSAAVSYWHREYGPLDRIPNIPKPPPNEPRERWLTRSEAARLVWQSRRVEHLKRIILIGLHTGSRYGVIRRMEWNWIDLGAGTMRRRAPGSAENHNKRTPPIRIPRKLRHFLRRWHKIDGGSGHVVKYDGRPLQGDPHTAWEAACKRANIKGASLHTMRHTVATWLLQRRVDPFQAAGFLGMSLKTLTNRYAKHHPDHQREAADI